MSPPSVGWIFFVAFAGFPAFGVAWSLKTGWASRFYLIGRDFNRKKQPVMYWLTVGGNGLVAITMLVRAVILFVHPAPGR